MFADTSPILSFCIATFNRREMATALVRDILASDQPIEVCIHVDGSTDGTLEELLSIKDSRLTVTSGMNSGSAGSRRAAVARAKGKFIAIYDDDDQIIVQNIPTIINHLMGCTDNGLCGIVVHYQEPDGRLHGSQFVRKRTNFLQMRFDDHVQGDKREIIRSEILKSVVDKYYRGARRVPTSLLWYRLALNYDVMCVDEAIGVKCYFPGGLTSVISNVKRGSPRPMLKHKITIVRGFLFGRHRSVTAAARSLLSSAYYSVFILRQALTGRQ
ncbi:MULTISPECIES: glycosyltransferase family 2 protein [unclassified Mesorhizobium]|uniref:glycosyltransferase family 2 protein n=2 Tax=unclassified Mesorhizobium TaxID=325217 RepID=UPI003335B191